MDCMKTQSTLLITGATSGLGLALARAWAPEWRLILVGRRSLAELDEALFSPATYCRADLADPPWAAATIAAWLSAAGIERLDLLIHNAALGQYELPHCQEPAALTALLSTNLGAPLALSHALLPWLERAQGRIVVISSVVAALPAPRYAAYAASKAALESWACSVRVELAPTVAVQVIRLGAMCTPMHARIGYPERTWRRFPAAAAVVPRIIRAIESGSSHTTIGWRNRLVAALGLWLARPLDWMVRRWH